MKFKALVLALVLMLGISAAAMAAGPSLEYNIGFRPTNETIISGDGQASMFFWNGSEWVPGSDLPSPIDPSAADDARSWNSGVAIHSCNDPVVQFNFTQVAELAQWTRFKMSSTRKDWFIKKPGVYTSALGTVSIMSNDNLEVNFIGFGALGTGQNEWMHTAYAVESIADPELGDNTPPLRSAFVDGEQLAAISVGPAVGIDESDSGLYQYFQLWAMVDVELRDEAGVYSDTGTIEVVQKNVTPGQAWLPFLPPYQP